MRQFSTGNYKAAIFDLDGTLADSMRVWDHICRDWLKGKGLEPEDGLEEKIAAMTLSQSAEYVSVFFFFSLPESQIKKECVDMVVSKYEKSVTLKDGAEEVIKLFAKKGLKLAIETSCFPTACENLLSRYDLRKYFSTVLSTDEVKRDKTFPDIYLACAEKLRIKPEDCVVFEDFYPALTGIKAAKMDAFAVYDESSALDWGKFKREADYATISLRKIIEEGE
jgi:HAD superfamily hydrolase (TIGR01509 family)